MTKTTGAQKPISVGIGSWADPEYTGILYPKGVKAPERLGLYATHFDHVEVNSSYYTTPKRETVQEWVAQTPADFAFDVKLHRVASQSPAKAAEGDLITRLLENLEPLIAAKKLGTFLLVLQPAFGPDKRKLTELEPLAAKLRPYRLAVELRNNGWVKGEERERTLEFFRAQSLVWVAVDMPQVEDSTVMPAIDEATNPSLAYLRLHGRNEKWFELESAEERHTYDYPAAELKQLAARVQALAAKAGSVHVVANNHAQDFAPKAALALRKLLREA